MVQIVRTFALTATIALAGCQGPVPGSDEWVATQEAKSAEFLRQCNADGATNCSYTYSYTKADNWFEYFINTLGDASSQHTPRVATHSVRHNPSNDNSSNYPDGQNAYGPGIHSDATGRPYTWQPTLGHTGGVLGPVKPNAYGPGIGMDATGKPVQAVPQD
jgi:hypothetical protein